jgi:hypothetical protein
MLMFRDEFLLFSPMSSGWRAYPQHRRSMRLLGGYQRRGRNSSASRPASHSTSRFKRGVALSALPSLQIVAVSDAADFDITPNSRVVVCQSNAGTASYIVWIGFTFRPQTRGRISYDYLLACRRHYYVGSTTAPLFAAYKGSNRIFLVCLSDSWNTSRSCNVLSGIL